MKTFTIYLTFDGNAREAMTFYQRCLGAELALQTFGEAPMDSPPGAENRVMHARLAKGAAAIMASDTMPGMPLTQGNNFSITIECESVAEAERLYSALGEGGKATMPLQDTFWGARFGMLTDKFGVNWMLNCQLQPQPA